MSKKVAWLGVLCLTVLSLVLASCGQTTTTTTQTTAPATTRAAPASATTAPTRTSQGTPKYGGTLTVSDSADVLGFDPAYSFSVNLWPALCGWTNNELMTGNWALGPASTNQTDWTAGYLGQISLETGSLATSWDLPDDSTIVYHIRQGVHFWNKAPVGGRELTASDGLEREPRMDQPAKLPQHH